MSTAKSPSSVIWLPSWYPSKLDAFSGDFIQRHAKALSAFFPVHVFYLVRDKNKMVTDSVSMEEQQSGNLKETIIYYYSTEFPVKKIESLLSAIKYKRLFKNYFIKYFLANQLPSGVHVHVPFKAGLIALWLKKKYRLNYIVTEHWAGYDRVNPENYFSKSPLFRYLTKKVLAESLLVTPVSEDLGMKLTELVPGIKVRVIPNTVDTSLFYYEKSEQNIFRFIHYVSVAKFQKNTEGLIRAFSVLVKSFKNWECILYGNASKHLRKLVAEFDLENNIKFTGEIPYEKVAEWVRSSSAFVAFSNFENQPCSILEALCCGLPVISTNVGGIKEIINEENGVLVEPQNENELTTALKYMIENSFHFDRSTIANNAQGNYSFNAIGKELSSLYTNN